MSKGGKEWDTGAIDRVRALRKHLEQKTREAEAFDALAKNEGKAGNDKGE